MGKTIQLTLEDELAIKYEQLSRADKDKIAAVIEDLLKAEGMPSEKKIPKRTDGLPTFDLGRKFDDIDFRKAAYE